jgi:CIC family chloride channel protein
LTTERRARFVGSLVLAILSPVAGGASGLVGAIFRLTLEKADRVRDAVIAAGHDRGSAGFLLVCGGAAAAVALAAWLVRRFSPYASGSGIPHVEAALNEEVPPTPPGLISVKFVGGVLAIGAGLALGREGPSVQMGAAIAHIVGRVCRRGWSDLRVLLAAGAGAGLATAFNAPIAGAVFVLEELVGRFEANIAISALGASAAAIAVARALLGDEPDFDVEPLAYVGVEALPLFVLLGIAAGLAAALYNSLLLGTLAAMDRLSHWPVEM